MSITGEIIISPDRDITKLYCLTRVSPGRYRIDADDIGWVTLLPSVYRVNLKGWWKTKSANGIIINEQLIPVLPQMGELRLSFMAFGLEAVTKVLSTELLSLISEFIGNGYK